MDWMSEGGRYKTVLPSSVWVGAVPDMSASEDYLAHAEECVRLANLTSDDFLKQQLLSLRQTYLRTAEILRQKENEERQH